MQIGIRSVGLLYPVFLVAVRGCSQCVFLATLDFCLDELELLRADAHPLGVLAGFRLVHDALEELIPPVTGAASDTGLGEVHYLKRVLPLPSVAYAEVKPLLVSASVRVHLHVETVLRRCNSIGTEQIARLKDSV